MSLQAEEQRLGGDDEAAVANTAMCALRSGGKDQHQGHRDRDGKSAAGAPHSIPPAFVMNPPGRIGAET